MPRSAAIATVRPYLACGRIDGVMPRWALTYRTLGTKPNRGDRTLGAHAEDCRWSNRRYWRLPGGRRRSPQSNVLVLEGEPLQPYPGGTSDSGRIHRLFRTLKAGSADLI